MAAAEEDDEDFHFFGTPIGDEEESRQGQHRKDVKDPAATRALPLHKQVRSRTVGLWWPLHTAVAWVSAAHRLLHHWLLVRCFLWRAPSRVQPIGAIAAAAAAAGCRR